MKEKINYDHDDTPFEPRQILDPSKCKEIVRESHFSLTLAECFLKWVLKFLGILMTARCWKFSCVKPLASMMQNWRHDK
jgi:hypothetical protein